MTDDLQPKIDKWWAGLTPWHQSRWWDGLDMALAPNGKRYYVTHDRKLFRTLVTVMLIQDFKLKDCTPAPCAQFWWKLFLWVRKAYGTLTIDTNSDTCTSFYRDYHRKLSIEELTTFEVGLLDAALAVQERGEG